MEREGLETVHTSLGGNTVVPEGGSFLEPPSIAKVPGEEICGKQIDLVPCLAEKNEKQVQKDEGFDITEEGATKENAVVDETKQIAEKDKQVDDVTGTILQMDKIEGPCLNIGEEEKIVKNVEDIEDGEAEVEGKQKSIEKEIGGPKKYEEGERKIEESVELETSKEVSSFEPSLSQGKEALSQTPDATVNNLDTPETVKEVCLENESKDSGTGDRTGTIDEQQIGEERNEGEKSESCSRFLDDKGTDVVKAIEKIENEKEGTTCDPIGGGTCIGEAGIDIRKEKETIPEIGSVQDQRNTVDIATVTHKTQEKQTEEMYSQQVDKSDICMVSETESEVIVNKSSQGEGQNVILEKKAEAGSSEGENTKDEMNPEQKLNGLFVKHEESKQSIHENLAMAEESTEESRYMESPTVIAAENNTSDALPITITTAQDHSVIADEDKIMDVVANIAPEHNKEKMSKYEDKIEENFARQDEAENEKIENSLALISGEIDTATSSEFSEAIASAKEDTPIKIPGESFENKKEEKPIDADSVVDSGLPIEKGPPPTDLNEKIEDAGLELLNKNSSELHISQSLEQETMPVQGEKQPKVSDFEPEEQAHEANGPSKDLEKLVEDASEACESMQNTNLEHPSAKGAITTEVSSKASEMGVEKEEKVHELESEKLEIDDAGTNLEEEMQKKEEAHDEQTYQMATSDRIEEVTSDKVCSGEFVDKNVEHCVQAAGFQEAETPLRNRVEENYEMSNIVKEEVIDEPKITDIGEVIDEEKIKDGATHLSSELVFDEKMVESSQDNETEAEMSKGNDVEEQMMEDDNAKVILQEYIQEASVKDFQNNGKSAEKSSREMYEVSEAAKKAETNNNDESPDSTLQTSLLKEQESLQTENLIAAAEEKDEDGSSIRKDEDEDNNNGIEEVECSEKETLKGEEDVEQISPKNEPRENLEHSAGMISAETEEVALNKMAKNTEEEIGEDVEDVKKEAEIGKEDDEEQVNDENNTKSISVESIKEVPVSKLLNDEKNAEEFKGEIFEESVTAGTNESIADATYQNDGTPNAALQTPTVKEVEIVQGEGKDTTPAEASPEEEEHYQARGLKRVEDNSSEIGLEEDLEKSDEETSKTIDDIVHETNQYTEFPNSTLETSPVEEQASLQRDNLTPAETSPQKKKYEDGSSNKKDEDNEKNTGLAEETQNAGETLTAEENLEQILQNNELIENPEQSITMICAETEADDFSKMVDNHEEEIVETPRGNAEAELLKEENAEGHVIEESNINSLSQESAEESPNFQNAEKNSNSTEEMLESGIAGGDETNQNNEDCNSSLTISLEKIDESFKGEDKNITPAEASPHDENEERGSLDRADDGNDSNPDLIVTNQDSVREALKVEEDFEQELKKVEPGEPEESSTVMAAETEAGTLSDKIDAITSQEEVVTIQNIEESVEKEKNEEHGSLDRAGEGNDSNPDLIVTNQDSTREASKVEQELQKVEPGEPEESATVMAAETEAGTFKIDDSTSQEEVVTIQNIEESVEKEKNEEHGSLDRAGEGNDSNPDLIVTNQDSTREASKVEQELQKVEPGEPEESATVMAAETEAGTFKIDDSTSQEEVVTIQNIEETIEKEKNEEHGSLDKAGEGNDSNPDPTVTNQDSAREASKVEQELQKVEPREPGESSTVMAAETEAGTLSDKIDAITCQEGVVTIQNIEETVEKEKNEEHGYSDKAGEGNDSNPDLTVTNQDSAREASKVEQELQKVEPREPGESSTVMAAETEAGTLSDKIDAIKSQEEDIEETIEKEKNEEHGSLVKAGEGNDSNPDLTVTNQDNAREASKVEEDFEQELQKIEPVEPEESSTVMASETEAWTLSDKIDENTSQEEVVTVQNIKETMEKEKKKGSEDIDVTKVKRVVMEEDLKLAAEASDARKSVENDVEQEIIISVGKEVETVEKTFGSDSIQKLEVEEKRENKEEETNIEDIKELCGDAKFASLSVDTEKNVTTEEHTSTDISPNNTGETTAEEKEKTKKEMEESVITSVDEDTEKKVPEEESAINDQSRITYEGDESGMLVEQEVHEIIQTAEKDGDIGKQGSVLKDNYEVPRSSTNEENLLHKETEDESNKVKPKDEVKDSNSEFTEPFEGRGSVDRQEFETLKGKQGPNSEIYLVKASEEGVSQKESNKSLIEISSLESESKEEILEEVQPDVNDSSSTLFTGITRETSFKEAEPEYKRQTESFEPAPQEKGPVTEGTERTTLETVEIDVKPEDASNFIENEDHGIPAACEAEELENEMHKETPTTGGQDNKEETTKETPLGNVLDDNQKEFSTMLPKESELMTNEGNNVIDENLSSEAGTLSDKTGDITSQDEFVSSQNIKEIVEKEKNVSLDKAGEGNDSNPDLTVTNQDSVREASKVEEDFEQELQKIEPGELEESSTVTAAETEAGTLSDKVDENTSQEEVVTIQNIEETIEKERKEGSEEIDVTKVKRVVMEEDLKLAAEASDAKKSVEKDVEEENIISGGKEVETVEKTFGLDSIQKLGVEEKRENKEEKTKNQDIKEVCGDPKLASLSVDTSEKEMEKSVITSVDEDTEKEVPEEESAMNDQSRIIYKGDESGMLVEQEVHEIIQTAEKDGDIGKQGSVIKDNYEVPRSSTNEENLLHKETEDESNKVKPKDEVKDSKSEFTEPFEGRGSVDRQEFETLRGKQGTNNEIYLVKASEEGVSQKESNKSLIEISSLESESKEEILEEVQHDVNDSSSTPITGITRETSSKKAEDNLTDNVEANKAAFELKEGTNNQEQAIGTKDYGVLAEENFEVAESGKKLEGVSETETRDQSSETIPETDPGKVENITEIQNKSLESVEQSSQESEEVRETDEKTELKFEAEVDVKETQNTDETVKDVILTEEVHEEVRKAGSETLKCMEKDVNDTGELYVKSTELVSITDSQGFEALKEDESTSGQTVPEEKLEEQNQTPSVSLLSKEKDCGTETMIENIEECVQVEIPANPQKSSSAKITEDTCLHKEETNELEVSGFGVELNTGIQKDSLNEVQVEESKNPDEAPKLQTPEYETSKEAFQSVSEVHGDEAFAAAEETEIKEKHPEVATTDLAAEENRSEKIIDAAEIIHDEVIEGTFERTSNLRTEISEEAFKSISEVHGHEVLAESEDTEIKEKHPELTVTDMTEENQSERTIETTEITHDKLTNEEIIEEKQDANNGDPVTLGEETTKESQEEYELKAEESLGDKGTEKGFQNEELYKEVEKADGNERIEKQMDTERIIEHLHLAAAENETLKESFVDEAGSELHLENQIYETASRNDGRTEAVNVKEEELDVEISQKEGPMDLVEANEATRDIHEEEETSKTSTEHTEEHVKEVKIEVDEHPQNSSAAKTTENTCSQKEEAKVQEVCGSGVECNTDMQKNSSNEFDEEEGRAPDEDSTVQPQGYENKIKDKEYPPESNKMTEITETGAFEKTSNLRTETSEEAFKSVSEVHEHEVLAESEHTEIKKEKLTEGAVTDLVAGGNQNKKTIDATEVVHDELTSEEDKQQFKEEKEDTKNCNPINLGEETTKESHQIYDLKAEKNHEDKVAKEIQNEELSNERSSEYLHQTAVENETVKESFPDEALIKNAEDMGTKLQVENQSDEKISGYDRTEATIITNEEFGPEISEKESLQAPAEANETTQDIHQGKRDMQSAEVGESGNAIGIVDAQGLEHREEKSIDEKKIKGTDEKMSAKISLFDAMQRSTRERQVGGDLTEEKEANESKEETRVEGEKRKSDEEKEEEEEEEGEEHKKTDSGSDAPVMVEASRDIVEVKVANKKHHNILSGVGSKVKHSISKVKKAITGKSSHQKQHSPK